MSRGEIMNIFEMIIIDLIFIIFPLTFWILYQNYSKTLNMKKSELLLDFALISSMYFVMKYGMTSVLNAPILFFNIPLIIAYLKNRKFSIIVLSITSICYYYFHLNFELVFLIGEYTFYYLVYLFIRNKKIENKVFMNCLAIFKLLFIFGQMMINASFFEQIGYTKLEFALICIFFYLVTQFVVYLLQVAQDILEVHLKFCELEHQKEITDSLFQITHEIKNPIAVCKGYLDMFDVNNIEHSKKYVPILKEEMDRLLILLQDFLSVNKIKVDRDIIDINLLLEDMLKSFFPIFKVRNIKANFSIDESELYVVADYNRLRQVLTNLIKNSMEAIPQNRNGIISVYLKKYPGNIKIYVEDNGEGISKEDMEKLKSPFFTTKSQGSGLGVYLCNEIVKAHKGSMKYFSKEKQGTKIVITLPYNKKDIKKLS